MKNTTTTGIIGITTIIVARITDITITTGTIIARITAPTAFRPGVA